MSNEIATDIQFTDQAFRTGVNAKKLNLAFTHATIQPAFVADKPAVGSYGAGDYLLLLKADGTYAKIPAGSVGSGTGGGGTTTVITWGETPTGAIDGTNKVYTSASAYVSGSIAVYLNGVRQRRTNDYSETTSTTFTMVNAPLAGDLMSIDYVHP